MPCSEYQAAEAARPSVLYLSYDGIEEPLGRSQVLSYLTRLAPNYAITLVSFEKTRPRAELRDQLKTLGIDWIPLRYHRRPPVLSTAWDVYRGVRTIGRRAGREPPDIVHVRSYVPALMALIARRRTGGKLLFDIRGFWADERVEGGIWRPGGLLYRLAKRCEARFFREADAVVTLTRASLPEIARLTRGRPVPTAVIPTCVAHERFADRPPRAGGPHLVWSGSLGTWYRFDLVPRLAALLPLPLTVITRQTDLARQVLGETPAAVSSVDPDEVPEQLFCGDVGLSLIARKPSKIASAPTRVGEYLAAGMPVIVTPVGDLRRIVEEHRVGVVLEGDDADALRAAVSRLRELMSDPELTERCRRVAREAFDVDAGSAQYAALYESLRGVTSSSPAAPSGARLSRQSR